MKLFPTSKAFQSPQMNSEPSFDLADLGRRASRDLEKAPKLTDPVPGRDINNGWAHQETPSCWSGSAKQAPPPAPTLAVRLRAHLSSLTVLEACTLFTLVHRRATGEDTLLKCAAAETGVSEA